MQACLAVAPPRQHYPMLIMRLFRTRLQQHHKGKYFKVLVLIISKEPSDTCSVSSANTNGKRPAMDLDPETEDRRKRARSSLALPQDYAISESNIRDESDGALAPSTAVSRAPTIQLNMTRSKAGPPADPLLPSVATSTPTAAEPGPTNLGRPPKRQPPPAPRVKVS